MDDQPTQRPVAATATEERLARDLRKREWLLETIERQRALSPTASLIERRAGLSRQEFLHGYYAANRPVILAGEMNDWPALTRWAPDYLAQRVGGPIIEFQGQRTGNARFEMEKDAHRREAPFDAFIDMIKRPDAGNDAYITAYNSARNAAALSVLDADLGFHEKFLTRDVAQPNGMIWIGPAGTVTSLHHDLTNNLIAQLVGRKQFKILPASEVGHVYNTTHVFSDIADLDDPLLDRTRFARLRGARMYDITLNAGEMIFMPIGWWHQVKALDFSVTLTYTNFLWPNDAHQSYPSD
jgi:ribosomal protein L16 Arg81 hydroxylase